MVKYKLHYRRVPAVLSILLAVYSPQLLRAQAADSDQRQPLIVVNQVGYYPSSYKTALLVNWRHTTLAEAAIIADDSGRRVAVFPVGDEKIDPLTNDRIRMIDFSSFQRLGKFHIRLNDLRSRSFPIGKHVYDDLLNKLLRSYYLQRCGVALADKRTGVSHPACHQQDGVVMHRDAHYESGARLTCAGGWHDAGDYGKYVATTTISIARLLQLYEQYPRLLSDDSLAIPESGNAVPDILDEARHGIQWLRTMQRPDGAVYRKLSGKSWPKKLTPESDAQTRYVYGISTPETAKFAAVMAMASRVYRRYDSAFAESTLGAARKAWTYLLLQTGMKVDFYEGDDSGSGPYLYSEFDTEASLQTDTDDRLWAAAELLITTRENKYSKYVSEVIDTTPYTLFEWKDPSAMAMTNLLLIRSLEHAADFNGKLEKKILQRADDLLRNANSNGYRLANTRFIWGSNKMAAEEGLTLLFAYRLTRKPEYYRAALDQLGYLLGQNHFDKVFVTGVGANPVKNVHHIFGEVKGISIPGLLVGGPNNLAQSGIAPKNMGPLSYADDLRSYATNEYAIDYNASLIGLVGSVIMAEYANEFFLRD